MSLGVLNNLSAVYAENNLNNTNNSLNTVLQQLSSGSKINSGADDAAGLSMVDGLQANQQALTQSVTNASEGVGLLQVADGALSQVTSLLNRAVTLATEASNGTLNSSQDTAANQEYQSILSEISNIGTTTTYNDAAVFGTGTNIYTGDSSTAGSSIDALNIRSLSSSNVGDTGGVMAYSNGQSSVFLNLSSGTQNANATDTLNSNGSSTIQVNFLVKGADGSSTASSTSITVGGTSGYANTVNGLVSAINNSGLGLTATFATQSQAGVAGGGAETGIQISGGLISVGVDPNASSTSGTLNPSEITNGDLTLGQTITVNTGSTTAASVTIDSSNDTLAQLASAINSGTGGSGGVTATVVYNSAGAATSLQLADNSSSGGALSVTATSANVVPNELTSLTTVQSSADPVAVNFTAGAGGNAGSKGTATLSIPGGSGSNNPSQALTGSIVLQNGSSPAYTFTMSAGSGSVSGQNVTLSAADSTLSGLASAIGTYLGATATANGSGISITSTATGTAITEGVSTLAAPLTANVNSNAAGVAASSGTDGTTVLSMSDAKTLASDGSDALTGSITLQNGSGTVYTFTMGTSTGYVSGTQTYTTGAQTVLGLQNEINASTSNTGLSASISNGTLVLTSNTVGTTINAGTGANNTLAGTTDLTASAGSAAPTSNAYSTVNVTVGTGNPANDSLTATGDTLAGTMTIANGGVTDTFIMGGSASDNTTNTFYTGDSTLASLQSTITGAANLGVTAALDDAAGGTKSGLTLTANAYGTTISTAGAGIVDTSTVGTDSQTSIGNVLTNTLSADDGGVLSGTTGLTGTFTISEAQTGVNGGASQDLTVVVGAAAVGQTNTASTLYIVGNNTTATVGQIATAITNFVGSGTNTGGDKFDFTASVDANTGGLTVQAGAVSTTDTALSITAASGSLTAVQTLAAGTVTPGSTQAAATLSISNGGTSSASDTLTEGTSLIIKNSAVSNTYTTFTMGGVTSGNVIGVGTAGDGSTQTLGALMTAIQGSGLDLSAQMSGGNLVLADTSSGSTGTITVDNVNSNLTDAYTAGASATNAGTNATGPTAASASLNTTAGMSAGNTLAGSITLANSSNGTVVTFVMGGTAGINGNTITLGSGSSTLNDLVTAISQNATLGITASINGSTGALQMQSNALDTSLTIGGGLTDAATGGFVGSAAGTQSAYSTGTFALGGTGNDFNASNPLTGSIVISANGQTDTFAMGGSTISVNGAGSAYAATVSGLESAIAGSNLNVSVGQTNGNADMVLTSNSPNSTVIGISNNTLQDSLGNATATASLGTFASANDVVSGTVNFDIGGNSAANFTIQQGTTVNELMDKINSGSYTGSGTSTADPYGVHASLSSAGNGYESLTLTSDTYGTAGNISNVGTQISDNGTSATLSYAANSAYSMGISNVAGTGVFDSTTQSSSAITGVSAPYANLTASAGTSGGTATISYSDGAGVSLSSTDLSNQTDAENALTSLNAAITDVAAQDGYIGAQINTLNAVSQVLSTQQENVESAQNAVQATDYASATSNMSKYEILSQTGIAALAQANSIQQEVTKLLQ